MIKAELGKQLMISVKNRPGALAEITSLVTSSRINMQAICAYEVANNVAIMMVTDDNNSARRLLEKKYHVQEEEVVLLTIDNQPGSLQKVTDKIAEAGIDLTLIYGSAEKSAGHCEIVIISRNNLDVMMVIKTELERH